MPSPVTIETFMLSSSARAALLDLARSALRERLTPTTAPQQFPDAPENPELHSPAGCFVTLHQHSTHKLRGCVGRLDATKPLWENVYHTTAETLRDPRFTNQPVTANELNDLELEISLLSPPVQAANPLDFDLLNNGIYLTFASRAGFFLPQVARETGWSKEQLLARLCTEKLGLPPEIWKHADAKLFKFDVEVVGPERV